MKSNLKRQASYDMLLNDDETTNDNSNNTPMVSSFNGKYSCHEDYTGLSPISKKQRYLEFSSDEDHGKLEGVVVMVHDNEKNNIIISSNNNNSNNNLNVNHHYHHNYHLNKEEDEDSLDSSIAEIFEEYFSTDDESEMSMIPSFPIFPTVTSNEKYMLNNFDFHLNVNNNAIPINTATLEIQNALRCPNHHGKIKIPWNVDSRIVAKLDDIIGIRHDRMMITTATKPYHIEWCNAGWSQFCGWSNEEVNGLSCEFLQGSGTDKNVIRAFMEMLESTGGFADMTIVNYSKYHSVLRNTIHCFPISDDCGFSNSRNITHIGVVLLESQEITNPSLCDDLIRRNPALQFDRRNQSIRYPYLHSVLPPHNPMDWINMTQDFTMSLMLRYMMRSQAPILLTTSEGKIVHVNSAFVQLTRFHSTEVESVSIMDMLGKKSKTIDVKKLESIFEKYDTTGMNLIKKASNTKSISQLELYLKRNNESSMVDQFKDYVRKTPTQLTDESEPCEFCHIYDENTRKMSMVNDTTSVYASVSRFNSEHIAILFNSRSVY